jgi:hypothetical protein
MGKQTRATPSQRQRATTKLAISLPKDLAEATRSAAHASHAPSLSAFIAETLEARLEQQRLDDILHEIFGDQPLTDEERQCLDRHFYKP